MTCDLDLSYEPLSFADVPGLPDCDLCFTACRASTDRNFVDVVDFRRRAIDRWGFCLPMNQAAVDQLTRLPCLPLGYANVREFYDEQIGRPHAAHLTASGRILVCMSDSYNGPGMAIIHTTTHRAQLFDGGGDPMCFPATGGILPDGRFLFAQWPHSDAVEMLAGRRQETPCEIGWLDPATLQTEMLCTLQGTGRIHQVACSPDGRFAVFCPFKWEAAQSRLLPEAVTTLDLHTGRHFTTPIPVPVPAHFEFDPSDPRVFYLSAHNFRPTRSGVFLAGPAAIFKLRIGDGATAIEGCYSHPTFFRLRQHAVFVHGGRTLIAATNFPNHVELIDAQDMSLLDRIETSSVPSLSPWPSNQEKSYPSYPESCFYVNPDPAGRLLILGSSRGFRIYDLAARRLLDAILPLALPHGCQDVGHTLPATAPLR
jgi:hypothetical protein